MASRLRRPGAHVQACALVLAAGLACFALAAAAPQSDATADSVRVTLEREGHVSYLRYDPVRAGECTGETRFSRAYSYTYTYRYEWQDRPGCRRLSVTPGVRAEASLRHTIELPRVSADAPSLRRKSVAVAGLVPQGKDRCRTHHGRGEVQPRRS